MISLALLPALLTAPVIVTMPSAALVALSVAPPPVLAALLTALA